MNSQKNNFIVFPMYPLNHTFQKLVMNKLHLKTHIHTITYIDLKNFNNYDELIMLLNNIIQNSNDKIYFVAFGIFARIAAHYILQTPELISGSLFIEPDFTNITGSLKLSIFFKKKALYKQLRLTHGLHNTPDKYLTKLKNDSFLEILEVVQEKTHNFKLFDLIKLPHQISIVWSKASNEVWPLPIILTEEYELPIIDAGENIFHYVQNSKAIFADLF